MVDPKLGSKRVCEACGAKFYDLNKSPITCPKCGHVYDPVAALAPSEPVREVEPTKEKETATDDGELEEDEDAMSLEDMASEEADDSDDEEETLEAFDDDDTLLEEEEEEEGFLETDEEDE